jgi:biotin carboxylase
MSDKNLLIFAKTSHAKTPYGQWLAGTGIHPIILTAQEYADSYRHMPEVYAFEHYDTNQLIDKMAYEIAQGRSLIGVFARAEADVIRAAQLRARFGIPGQSVESAIAFRNKVDMKDRLRGAGVALPAYAPIDSAYTVLTFVETHGYPVVIKPVSESGSLGTQIIHNEQELDAYLAEPKRWNMEIEAFVPGPMFHVDGLWINGEIAFIIPFRYVNDCLSFRKNLNLGHCTVSPEEAVYPRLIAAVQAVLAALPCPPAMAFHTELWLRPDGEIVFCEVASRTGGAMITSIVHQFFGVQLDREWLMAECGLHQPISPRPYRPGGALNVQPRDGILLHIPRGTEPDFVHEVQITGPVGKRYHGGIKSGLFLAGYVISGADEAEVVANIARMDEWVATQFAWNLSPGAP